MYKHHDFGFKGKGFSCCFSSLSFLWRSLAYSISPSSVYTFFYKKKLKIKIIKKKANTTIPTITLLNTYSYF